MDFIIDLLSGLKSGEYWFIRVAAMLNMASILLLFIIDRSNYKTNEDRNNALNFGVRLLLATLTIFVCCNLFVILPGNILKYAVVIACVITLIMMIKVEKLPIWEERAE